MIKHCVFLSLAEPKDLSALNAPLAILESLVGVVPGLLDLAHGPNRDFEAKTPNHHYGFVMSFADRAALETYAQHPRHQDAGAMLVAACAGGYDGILVADLETAG